MGDIVRVSQVPVITPTLPDAPPLRLSQVPVVTAALPDPPPLRLSQVPVITVIGPLSGFPFTRGPLLMPPPPPMMGRPTRRSRLAEIRTGLEPGAAAAQSSAPPAILSAPQAAPPAASYSATTATTTEPAPAGENAPPGQAKKADKPPKDKGKK